MAGAGRAGWPAMLAAGAVLLSGCSWVESTFGGKSEDAGAQVSVFEVQVGQCFTPPDKVKVELSELTVVPCSQAHTQEAFGTLAYRAPEGVDGSIYPGDAALSAFAQGACAQAFTDYVGVSYLDSSLFFTYLVPSARSWEQGKDRSVLCFITTTGDRLTDSVKGSKR